MAAAVEEQDVAVKAAPKSAARPSFVGLAGTQIYAGQIQDLDPNAEVRDDLWYGSPGSIGLADKMWLVDAHVRRGIDSVRDPLQSAKWDVEPASKSALDKEIADFIFHNLFERIYFEGFVNTATLWELYGAALFEQTDAPAAVSASRFPKHPNPRAAICLTGFHERPLWTISEWRQRDDDPTRLAYVRQLTGGSDAEPTYATIYGDRLVRFTWDQRGAKFTGHAPARAAHGSHKQKLVLYTLAVVAHEKSHVGAPVLKAPPEGANEPDLAEEASRILRDWRSHHKGYAYLPPNWELDWLRGSEGTEIEPTIARCNRDIAKVWGIEYQELSTGGSYALAGAQKSNYEIGLDKRARFFCGVLNIGLDGWSVVERLVRLNYGPDVALPRVVVRSMPTRDFSKVLPLVHNLGISGFIRPGPATEYALRTDLDLPLEDEVYEGTPALKGKPTPVRVPGMRPDGTPKEEAEPVEETEE